MRGMEPPKYLSIVEVAQRLGLGEKTIRNYHQAAARHRREKTPKPGDFPEPDDVRGRSPGWLPETVDTWLASRPGQGAGGGRPWHRDGDSVT